MAGIDRTFAMVAPLGGLIVGAAVGGSVLWLVGTTAFASGETPTGMLTFFLAITSLVFAVVSPFVIAAFVRSRVAGKARKQLVTVAGFAFAILFFLGIGAFGVVFLADVGIDSAIEGIAVFDAVAGVVYGGIVGWEVTERAMDRHHRNTEPDPWS